QLCWSSRTALRFICHFRRHRLGGVPLGAGLAPIAAPADVCAGDDSRDGVGTVTATQTGPSRRALRIAGAAAVAVGLLGAFVMPYPDNAVVFIGFGGAGLMMLVRAATSGRTTSRIPGAIMLAIGVAGAVVLYSDNHDLVGAIIWLVGLSAIGTYLI